MVEHTFSADGIYTVSYREFNRNNGIINISSSAGTPFYVESSLLVSLGSGCNQTPLLTVPPIDRACTGQAFFHIPGSVDPEGDSLHYSLVIPKSSRDSEVADYQSLLEFSSENEEGGQPQFFIDPSTGLLQWDAPGMTGEYVIAIRIDEYRKTGNSTTWVGSTIRDMQILVNDCANRRPLIAPPLDTCLSAGADFNHPLYASDPDNDLMKIELFGELGFLDNLTTNIPDDFFPGPTQTFEVSWQPECDDLRQGSYVLVFKITDQSSTNSDNHIPLSSFVTWKINILTPAPELQEVTLAPEGLQLTWEEYIPCGPIETIEIYRRVGNEPLSLGACALGLSQNSGYVKIADVAPDDVAFLDKELIPAATLCYRLIARKADGSPSSPSREICFDFVPANRPIITHVSVERTDRESGEVIVGWRKPLSLELPDGPHEYTIERRTTSTSFIEAGKLTVNAVQDSIGFMDNHLNTSDSVYTYRVLFTTELPDTPTPISEPASTVRLTLMAQTSSVILTWISTVPWSNKISGILHSSIRTEGEIRTIEKVNPLNDGFQYSDNDINVSTLYCYRIATRGSYGNDIIPGPFVNYSQTECIRLNDAVPPDQVTFLPLTQDCDQDYSDGVGPTFNSVGWQELSADDIDYFQLQFKSEFDQEYEALATVNDLDYTHFFEIEGNMPVSRKGCYRIRAVDFSANAGAWSEDICIDNCVNLEFPNILTPNNDGCNEVFYPFSILQENQTDCGPAFDPSRNIRYVDYPLKFIIAGENRFIQEREIPPLNLPSIGMEQIIRERNFLQEYISLRHRQKLILYLQRRNNEKDGFIFYGSSLTDINLTNQSTFNWLFR